jgi:O-antigen/teichoic acid export membrane protein
MIRHRLLRGTLSNCVGKLIAVGSWFFLTPIVLAKLGGPAYALWVLVGAIASYGMLLEGGFGGAVIKYVAEHVARGERSEARSLIASAVWLYAGLAVLAVLVSVTLAPVLPPRLHIEPDQYSAAVWLIQLTGLNIACAIAATPATSVLRGLHRYDLHNAVIAVNSIAEAVMVTAILFAGGGLIGMMLALIAANLISGVISVTLVARIAPDLRLGLTGATRASFKRLALFSTALFPIEAGRRLQSRADGFIIAAFSALSAVTPYALARRLAELSELASVQFLRVLMPVASELHAGNDEAKLRQLYLVSSRIALAISTLVTVALVVDGRTILTLWVGAKYAEHANLLSLLAVATLFGTSQWPAAEVLLGMARHRVVAIASCLTASASILLSILLLPRIGLLGVAIAALVPTAISSICVVMLFAAPILRVSPATLAREVWVPALVPGGAAAIVLILAARQPGGAHLLMFLSTACVAALVYGALYLAMPAAGAERRLITDLARSAMRARRATPALPSSYLHRL